MRGEDYDSQAAHPNDPAAGAKPRDGQNAGMTRRSLVGMAGAAAAAFTLPLAGHAAAAAPAPASPPDSRRLYIAVPGIRNYVQYGGVGVLVYDIDNGYKFVKRIPTWAVPAGQQPENVKGIEASAKTNRLYVSTINRLGCIDLISEQMIWENELPGGCDRMSLSPDSKTLYVPSFERDVWNVVDARSGELLRQLVMNNRAHNTLYGIDGKRVYLEGLGSPYLHVIDPATNTEVGRVGPFSASVRPFTVNGAQTLCYTSINNLLGFGIGDLRTGEVLHEIQVPQSFERGPVARHGCPSHGVGLTPDESEVWVSDGHNVAMHIYDNTVMPPTYKQTIFLRNQPNPGSTVPGGPGWISFSIDGKHAFPSSGEVFDTRTKERIAALYDEEGRQVGSEKLLEVDFRGRNYRNVVAVGDQFAMGQKV